MLDCLIKELEGSRKTKVFKFAWNLVGPFASGLVGPAEIAKVLSCVVIWDTQIYSRGPYCHLQGSCKHAFSISLSFLWNSTHSDIVLTLGQKADQGGL